MTILLLVFFSAFIGMIVIPYRRMLYVRRTQLERALDVQESNSVIRVRVRVLVDWLLWWYRVRAREEFLKFIDKLLKLFERAAGKIAGRIKTLRIMIQEQFRVIPRESLYWKQIHIWKKENGNTIVENFSIEFEDSDISNHIER